MTLAQSDRDLIALLGLFIAFIAVGYPILRRLMPAIKRQEEKVMGAVETTPFSVGGGSIPDIAAITAQQIPALRAPDFNTDNGYKNKSTCASCCSPASARLAPPPSPPPKVQTIAIRTLPPVIQPNIVQALAPEINPPQQIERPNREPIPCTFNPSKYLELHSDVKREAMKWKNGYRGKKYRKWHRKILERQGLDLRNPIDFARSHYRDSGIREGRKIC